MLSAAQSLIDLTERGWMPDAIIRAGIRALLRQRLASLPAGETDAETYLSDFLAGMASAPVAVLPEKANQQHYEVPAAFFEQVLGRHRKYSSCLWHESTGDLDSSECAALEETCRHADLRDGQQVLELGCGWGSLSLWMAEHYPNSRIIGVSNSHSQREHILARAARSGVTNLEILTCDMNEFDIARRFDRIVSVEMFEHMRNWPRLFERVARWLQPEGRFFLHVFCHREVPYPFEVQDESDWMSRYFFSGGMMPCYDLPGRIGGPLAQVQRWQWNGRHYQKTANAWLANMDRNRAEIWPILSQTYGEKNARTWWVRWRIFFMACAELFGYKEGTEWFVGHYLFRKDDGHSD